jgi:putative DNA primase/helicase
MVHGMFECDETEQHLLRVLASCLYGNNRWEQFYVLTGKGGNGKGMINTLLRRVFGAYHQEVPVSLFTKISDKKDQPMPELVEARNKRLLMASESEKQDTLQIGILKGISGNDMISARTLYSGYVHKYVAPFKLFFQFNGPPKLSKLDDAIKRRMIVIDFPFQFRESNKMNDGLDPSMNRIQNPDMKIACTTREDWRDEFLLMLTEIYTEIKDWTELPAPSKIREATEQYMDTNNPLKEWLAEYYEITKNESDFILSSELKKNFHYDTKIEKMTEETFKDLMTMSDIQNKRMNKGKGFFGLKRRCMIQGVSSV